jgi:hypothetical protein
VQIRTPGTPSLRESVSALWGPKALDNIATLELRFPVERDKMTLRRFACLLTSVLPSFLSFFRRLLKTKPRIQSSRAGGRHRPHPSRRPRPGVKVRCRVRAHRHRPPVLLRQRQTV